MLNYKMMKVASSDSRTLTTGSWRVYDDLTARTGIFKSADLRLATFEHQAGADSVRGGTKGAAVGMLLAGGVGAVVGAAIGASKSGKQRLVATLPDGRAVLEVDVPLFDMLTTGIGVRQRTPSATAPWIASAASAIIPGSGQAVNRKWKKAGAIFVAMLLLLRVDALAPLVFFLWVGGIVDAYRDAKAQATV